MTNEEAIKILKSKMDGSVDTSYEWAETVRMAIEALSNANQHVQHVGSVDLISRSVAIKTLTDREHDIRAFIEKEDMEYEEAHSYWCEISGIHNSVEILESLPSAQTEKPKIIMCKDCKYYKAKQSGLPWNNSRRYCNRSVTLATNPDDFCSYGERTEK